VNFEHLHSSGTREKPFKDSKTFKSLNPGSIPEITPNMDEKIHQEFAKNPPGTS
jgi:hypothetical protein